VDIDSRAQRIAVIGGGQMARALVGGWLQRAVRAEDVAIAEPVATQRDWLADAFPGVQLHSVNADAAATAAVWLLAVKPQFAATVARALAPLAQALQPLVVSVAAGIRCRDLELWFGPGAAVVRAMPNRPALIGAGVTAVYAAPAITAAQRARVAELLAAVGSVVWLDAESQIDAVTAVSGSGPAYFFRLIELLEAAAIEQGLPASIARQLAVETAHGAGRLAHACTDDPATLRAQVTSPGGTTAAALAVLDAADLHAIVSRAVAAATARARELADEFGQAPGVGRSD